MKLYYAHEGERVVNSVQEDYDRIGQFKSKYNYVLQEEVGRDNSALKYIDGVVIPKTTEEIYAETIPNLKRNLKSEVDAYVDERVDAKFFAVVRPYFKDETKPKCKAVVDYVNEIYAYYLVQKAHIYAMESYDNNFAQFGDEPYSFAECMEEL